ncbi:hypothetical protein [Hymenobacter yonginensis]|uniref:Lipoprotein n=1 Tax=Hymenobacter yonginensis TaxID=748197 RepID=A0ABY7PPE3_9BACT|nr:hypothetical protein [Hymenobacter yonginensis]WBO84487.1 hypothetical protein O9Z63_19225 [Hymenobacter yonginensis]
MILISCNGFRSLPAEYIKNGKDYECSLTVKKDSTFALVIESIDSRSGCEGKWKLNGDTLLLHCDDAPFPAQIASGYMSEREMKLIILNESKLKFGQIILKRIKE